MGVLLEAGTPCWSRYTSEETAAHGKQTVSEESLQEHVTKLPIYFPSLFLRFLANVTSDFFSLKMLKLICEAGMNDKARRKKS